MKDPIEATWVKEVKGVNCGQRKFVQNRFIHVIIKVHEESKGQLHPSGSA